MEEDLIKKGILKEVKETVNKKVDNKKTSVFSQIVIGILIVPLLFCLMIFEMTGGFVFSRFVIFSRFVFVFFWGFHEMYFCAVISYPPFFRTRFGGNG